MDGGMERKLLNLWVNRISVMVASVMVSRLKSYVVQVDLAQPDEGPDRSEMLRVVLLLCNI